MSRTTDYILDEVDAGRLYFDGTAYISTQGEDLFDQFERAEFELDLALTNWKQLRCKINNKKDIV
ncbi:hypothetical protein HOB87_09670 [Candidatus Woesearchaeota archaeon]|jgi:hypothetical protein|nr:hypothetical protein [Candidatus Woesearchaeota archaeon]MBT6930214.1 hypothetical protein [Candidatus Neomarinimicrobiota bacterium]